MTSDFTNLAWPETPFGANQRPFGTKAHMVAGFGVEWDPEALADGRHLLRSVSTVYLRVTPARPLPVSPATLPFGFRVCVASGSGDGEQLIDTFDRALVRAHRHAAVLAGRSIGTELGYVLTLTSRRRPGLLGVRRASVAPTKARGMARIVDTCGQPDENRFDIDLYTPLAADDGPTTVATQALRRSLAVALTAASERRLMSWQDTFMTTEAVACAAWDVLGPEATSSP
jgi:hypothetical protein